MEPFTKALLDRARSLVGGELRGVHYDVAPSLPESSLSDSAAAHPSVVAVDLHFDNQVVRVLSSDEFTDGAFELSLHEGPVPDRQRGSDDATSTNGELPWSELIGQTVVSSKIHWVDSPYIALTKRRKAFSSHHFDVDGAIPFSGPQAPLALELHFANERRVLLVSGGWKGVTQPIVETGTGISVLWDSAAFATLVPRIAKELKKSW
jgi:hypothetical protein